MQGAGGRRAGGEGGCRESCGMFSLECMWPSGKLPSKQPPKLASELTQLAMEGEGLKYKRFTDGTITETTGRRADPIKLKGHSICLGDHPSVHPSFYTPNYLFVN